MPEEKTRLSRADRPRFESAELRVEPRHAVPLSRQIAAQIGGAIREDRCPPGGRLPSVRALSGRLGVHRNTVRAAYRELAAKGLVETRRGSGTYVRDSTPPYGRPPASPERDSFRSFLARERASGRSATAVEATFERWREAVERRRLTVVEPRAPDRELAVREASLALPGVEVAAASLEEARRSPPSLDGRLVLAPTAHVSELSALLSRWVEVFPARRDAGRRERRALLRVPAGSALAVVSESDELRRRARDLAAGLRGGEVKVVWARPGSPGRVARCAGVARFVLSDVASLPRVREVAPAGKVLEIRLLSADFLAELATYLGLGPTRAGGRAARPPRPSGAGARMEFGRRPSLGRERRDRR